MDRKKDIIKMITEMSGKYSAYEIFTDWIRCGAIAINNSCQLIHDKVWTEREQMYMDTMRKYTKEEQRKLSQMFAMLAETLEEPSDVLGQVYMESGMGSKAAGQFFTPYHLSELCANVGISKPDENGKYIINEPSCGGGGMIIAAASVLKGKGIDYQKVMEVTAQDLDWKAVYMCYVQLSLIGVKATVVQGNTLMKPYPSAEIPQECIFRTPAKMGLLLK